MEVRVAVLPARGVCVREIAASPDRKESTVRSDVKPMVARPALSGRTDLVGPVPSPDGVPEGSTR